MQGGTIGPGCRIPLRGGPEKRPPDAATGSTICHRWPTGLEQLPAAGPGQVMGTRCKGNSRQGWAGRGAGKGPCRAGSCPPGKEDRAKLCTERPRAPNIQQRSWGQGPSAPPQHKPSCAASLASHLQHEMPHISSPTNSAHITLLPEGDLLPWLGCTEHPSEVRHGRSGTTLACCYPTPRWQCHRSRAGHTALSSCWAAGCYQRP